MHSRLTELSEQLRERRAALLATADSIPRERWTERAQADRWSVSEVLLHLNNVERGIAGLVASAATEARSAGHPEETSSDSVLGSINRELVLDRSRRITAPSRIEPRENLEAGVVLGRLDESRAALHSAINAADGLALGQIIRTHPVLGDIDLYQWVEFVGEHEARHAQQIAEVGAALESSGR